MHLVELMTSWCLICDVWFLDPQEIRPGETPVEFANRVKAMIAQRARLKNVNWDGYMKHWRPSERFREGRQKVFADTLSKVLRAVERAEEEAEAELDDIYARKSPSFSFQSTGSPFAPLMVPSQVAGGAFAGGVRSGSGGILANGPPSPQASVLKHRQVRPPVNGAGASL